MPVRPARVSAPPSVAPLAPESYRIQFTADADTCEQLRLAQDMLRHQIPDGDVGRIFARALKALLRELAKEKFAATDRPRKSVIRGDQSSKPGSRHIPAEVKRTVWLRDGGRCAFIARDGRRCAEKGRLEFHHVDPCALGGGATVDNIELRCRAHNEFQAELDFGLGAYRSAAADAG